MSLYGFTSTNEVEANQASQEKSQVNVLEPKRSLLRETTMEIPKPILRAGSTASKWNKKGMRVKTLLDCDFVMLRHP